MAPSFEHQWGPAEPAAVHLCSVATGATQVIFAEASSFFHLQQTPGTHMPHSPGPSSPAVLCPLPGTLGSSVPPLWSYLSLPVTSCWLGEQRTHLSRGPDPPVSLPSPWTPPLCCHPPVPSRGRCEPAVRNGLRTCRLCRQLGVGGQTLEGGARRGSSHAVWVAVTFWAAHNS